MPSPALAAVGLALVAAPLTFDHSPFDALLRQHVHEGLVDYEAFAELNGIENRSSRAPEQEISTFRSGREHAWSHPRRGVTPLTDGAAARL